MNLARVRFPPPPLEGRKDPTASSYDASGTYAFNRTGRPIIITKPAGTTRYLVQFRGLSALLGAKSTVHVTGYNNDDIYCTPQSARFVKAVVEVRCDSRYTVFLGS